MYTATILIPVVDEFHYIFGTVNQIKKHKHPEVNHEIIIADQSNTEALKQVYKDDPEIKVISIPRVDAGYPINEGALRASGDYFCSIDADCFPIHNGWLYAPIKAIEKYGLSFVGKATGLHDAYKSQGKFFHINNYYRISTTETARKIALDVGFMRYENRYKVNFNPRVDCGWNLHCDNGVVAQFYSDQIKLGPKLSLAMNKVLGTTNEMGVYGMTIDNLVIHMVFGYGKEWIENVNKTLGQDYLRWEALVKEKGLTEEVIKQIQDAQIIKYQILYDRHYWDGNKETTLTPNDPLFVDFSNWKKEAE